MYMIQRTDNLEFFAFPNGRDPHWTKRVDYARIITDREIVRRCMQELTAQGWPVQALEVTLRAL